MNEGPTRLLSIGDFARRSQLSISALRFYADCGLLIPARIDGETGYRYYSTDQLRAAELIRNLRAFEMPIADIQSFLAADPSAADALLDCHWRRLQERTERNRRALRAVQSLLRSKETSMSATTKLEGNRLASAIRQVLPAAGDLRKHEYPAAVLIELTEDGLRLAATDGHRLAVRDLPTRTKGSGRSVIGAEDAKRLASLIEDMNEVHVSADAGLSFKAQGQTLQFDAVRDRYPDYEAILQRTGSASLLVKCEDLAPRLTESADLVVLSLSEKECAVNGTPVAARYTGNELRIALNPAYLSQAVTAGVGPDVVLQLGGPLDPVVIRSADDGTLTWLVMPIRLTSSGA